MGIVAIKVQFWEFAVILCLLAASCRMERRISYKSPGDKRAQLAKEYCYKAGDVGC